VRGGPVSAATGATGAPVRCMSDCWSAGVWSRCPRTDTVPPYTSGAGRGWACPDHRAPAPDAWPARFAHVGKDGRGGWVAQLLAPGDGVDAWGAPGRDVLATVTGPGPYEALGALARSVCPDHFVGAERLVCDVCGWDAATQQYRQGRR
jgi:hypothetical protein